jgi:hypothetical protein
MGRILLVLAVAALVAAMMVATAVPAFAYTPGSFDFRQCLTTDRQPGPPLHTNERVEFCKIIS